MKTIIALSILFSTIAWLPVRAELTETDLENIRQILREEFRDIHVALDEMDASLGEIEVTVDEIDAHFDTSHQSEPRSDANYALDCYGSGRRCRDF